jgi:hypothetical protein
MVKGKGSKFGMKDGHAIVPFKFLFQPLSDNTTGTHVTDLDLATANFGTRVQYLDSTYRTWRFARGLKVRQWMDVQSVVFFTNNQATVANNTVGNQGLSHAVGFWGGAAATIATTPGTLEEIVEMYNARSGPSQQVLTLNVPLSALREAQVEPWMRTPTSGTLPFAQSVSGGSLWFGYNSSQGFPSGYPVGVWAEITGAIEFAEPIDPSIAMRRKMPALLPPVAEEDEKSDTVLVSSS